ncbi:MAG: hypothetical protein AAGA96_18685, partial [Verrucomicrobiota bacterium]
MKQPSKQSFAGIAAKAAVLLTSAALFTGCGGGGGEEESGGEEAPAADAGSGGAGQMVLTTEIPPQKIEGTPQPIKVPVLEPAPQEAPKLSVPEGTVLLSQVKPVTSSDDFPIIGEVELITDGEKDAGEGYFVELMDGMQWVQIDLEQSAEIHGIWIWPNPRGSAGHGCRRRRASAADTPSGRRCLRLAGTRHPADAEQGPGLPETDLRHCRCPRCCPGPC